MAYNLYRLGLGLVSEKSEVDEKFRNFDNADNIFGQNKQELIAMIVVMYYSSYVALSFLLFIFAALLTCGAYKVRTKFNFASDSIRVLKLKVDMLVPCRT